MRISKKTRWALFLIVILFGFQTLSYSIRVNTIKKYEDAISKLMSVTEKYQTNQFQIAIAAHKSIASSDIKEALSILKKNIQIDLPLAKKYYDSSEDKSCERKLCRAIKYAEEIQ